MLTVYFFHLTVLGEFLLLEENAVLPISIIVAYIGSPEGTLVQFNIQYLNTLNHKMFSLFGTESDRH